MKRCFLGMLSVLNNLKKLPRMTAYSDTGDYCLMLLSEKVTGMEKILLADLPRADKVIKASQEISGLEFNKLTTSVNRNIERQFVFLNTILKQYPIQTFDDYAHIAPAHLDQMIQGLKRVCRLLKKFAEKNDFINATGRYEGILAD